MNSKELYDILTKDKTPEEKAANRQEADSMRDFAAANHDLLYRKTLIALDVMGGEKACYFGLASSMFYQQLADQLAQQILVLSLQIQKLQKNSHTKENCP